ncbi:MAG: GatB/YqeY domain-containing protein [Candidatus Spechtbacterales bacterium]|nr:GatB/YqeY domain-containing protein [Candidatus Spechtbacterales bacterium]
MSLREDIQNDLKEAVKSKNETATLVLRSLNSAIKNKEIETGQRDEGLPEEEIEKVVLSELKKRKEAKDQYVEAGRDDLAANEIAEAKILEKYAPERMGEEEIKKIIDDIIKETGASGMQDMGKVMKQVMAKVGNNADGSVVNSIVRDKLQ